MCRVCYIKTLPHEAGQKLASSAMGYKNKWHNPGDIITIGVKSKNQKHIDHIMAAVGMWGEYANLHFQYTGDYNQAMIRIDTQKGAGSWSYIGTDSKYITSPAPTMNLGWIDSDIEKGKRDTTLHEIGHALGLGHEHQNPKDPFNWNESQVIKDLSGPPNNWTEAMIRHNVLNAIKIDEVDATTLDRDSIMMYWFPDSWVKNGQGTKQNNGLSILDKTFISLIYPKPIEPPNEEKTKVQIFIQSLIYNRAMLSSMNNQQLRVICAGLELISKVEFNDLTKNKSNIHMRLLIANKLKLR